MLMVIMDFKGSIGYLIHELANKITAESDQVLFERYGIGFSQYKVLMVLEAHPGIPQKQIANTLNQTEASISRQIGLLIDNNLVEIGSSKDSRQHLIYLTPRGEEMVLKSTSALNNYLAPYFGSLSDRQKNELVEVFQALRTNFNI